MIFIKLTINENIKIENFHLCCQQGYYFNEKIQCENGIVLFSNYIEDSYWNFARIHNIPATHIFKQNWILIREMFIARNRIPALYIISKNIEDYNDFFSFSGLQLAYTEMWMKLVSEEYLKQLKLPENVFFKEVTQPEDLQLFIEIFSKAFEGVEKGYIEAIKHFPLKSENLHQVKNIIAFYDCIPVGIITGMSDNITAGIYNVGVIPEYRQKGLGKLLMSQLVKEFINDGVQSIFLQPEAVKSLKGWYEKIGFKNFFQGLCFEEPNFI